MQAMKMDDTSSQSSHRSFQAWTGNREGKNSQHPWPKLSIPSTGPWLQDTGKPAPSEGTEPK